MKVKKISNTSEIITYHELEKGLIGSNNPIFAKIPIKDVLDQEIFSELNKKEKNMFNSGHFDFVVTNADHLPLFAVEFDGPHHFEYEKAIKKDIRKNRICQLASLPLIRVTDTELEKHDSISVLQFMAYRFVKWQTEYQRIKNEVHSEIAEMSQEKIESLTKNGFLDPSIDPSFRFDIEFPFPLQKEVEEQIHLHGIYPDFPKKGNKSLLWYAVSPGDEEPAVDGNYYISAWYGVYEGFSSSGKYLWKYGKLENNEVNVLVEGKIKFGLKWVLITDENYKLEEPPYVFQLREGFLPLYYSEIPGASIPSIAQAVTEYLCLKKILKWVKNNLVTL